MDVEAFLNEVRRLPGYAAQIVYVREVPARAATLADPRSLLAAPVQRMLREAGISRLYAHQADAIDRIRAGEDVLLATGTASGKTLCYVAPVLESLACDPQATTLALFPTKALCQDQYRGFADALKRTGLDGVLAGVYDGDTLPHTRRRLRDRASVVFSNPDMLHAALMPEHERWARFLARLRFLVVDELHVYNGLFGANAANLFRRFFRVCRRHGSEPQLIACSATVGNPGELAARLSGRAVAVVDNDGSPRGRRIYVFWNPPRARDGDWRSRRSANVEAHELMARLLQHRVPTITFSKAKMTAEMIYRYVTEALRRTAPELADCVSAYRGGYLPEERREIERRLFSGELLGVSCTPALELGIDVSGLDASILVGYPGTLSSFFQQAGRAGRQDRDALAVLVGLDTAINQYIMSQPDYIFERPVELAVIEPDNPFVVINHLRCAAYELPLREDELELFGPSADLAVDVLERQHKLNYVDGRWYHAAPEIPHHEFSLRGCGRGDVVIQDAGTGAVLGQLNQADAAPIVHPDAIYMHRGDTYRVLELDLGRHMATVKREETDYYTQPLGGMDVHHIDHCLREKEFGAGRAFWGEVTAYDHTWGYEKVHFYSLDPISRHQVKLPVLILETTAFWLVPPEKLMEEVRAAGLDAHGGLRAIGYATRMLLPLFITCDTLDFSHSVGSVNSPWNAVFVFERHPHGLGFTEAAYERLHELVPAVLDHVRACPCEDGCPCCVGKPLRQDAVWNVERGEGSIPSKRAAIRILGALLGDGMNLRNPDAASLSDSDGGEQLRLEMALRRRLERMREPEVLHPIEPSVAAGYPEPEAEESLAVADPARRASRRVAFHKELERRVAKHIDTGQLAACAPQPSPPPGMVRPGSSRRPTDFPGRPAVTGQPVPDAEPKRPTKPIILGDPIAARARRRNKP